MESTGAIDHELWQSRLSRFGRVLALVSLIYLGVSVGFSIDMHHPLFDDTRLLPSFVASLAFAALWLLLRGVPRPRRTVRAIELSTLFVGTSAFSAMALVM